MDPSGCCVENNLQNGEASGREGNREDSRKATKEAMSKAQQKDSCSDESGNVQALDRSRSASNLSKPVGGGVNEQRVCK